MNKGFVMGFILGAAIFAGFLKAESRQETRKRIEIIEQLQQCRQSEENYRIIVDDLYSVCECK